MKKICCSLLVVLLAGASNAPAATTSLVLTSVFAFPTGQSPDSGVIQGTNGLLYAATATGGANSLGAIYLIATNGGLFDVISFDGANGSAPFGPLVQGSDGNVYGTTSQGGSGTNGTIFKISPSDDLTTLVFFRGTNGAGPYGGLIDGTDGRFYGTTTYGGTSGFGTVFRVSSGGTFSNLVLFEGTNGANPYGALVEYKGAFYGTTRYGGASGSGTVFQMTTNGVLKTLVSFNGNSGGLPNGLAIGRDQNFYGTTFSGGANLLGTIFKVTSRGTVSYLLSFDGGNGSNPTNSSLFLATNGNLYGTTTYGGTSNYGTLFQISTNGIVTPLASFTGTNSSAPGSFPQGSLIQGMDGNVYGTASGGDTNAAGNVFKISGFPPAIVLQPKSQTVIAGRAASFNVSAIGSPPLSFQWQWNGTNNLTNGDNVSGAQTANLIIENITSRNAGSYSVLVTNTNSSSAATSSNAVLKVATRLVAEIASPRANLRTNALTLTVSGTATDDTVITNMTCWFTNVNDGTTKMTAPALSSVSPTKVSWMITTNLNPGTNIVSVQGIDLSNNVSPTVTRTFFLELAAPLSLTVAPPGNGTVTGPANNALLNIGERYTLAAIPAENYVLTNWTLTNLTSSTGSTSNGLALQFIMEKGLEITATFTTNLFIGAAGSYNGLFYPFDAVIDATEETSGMLSGLTLKATGVYSGSLLLGGASYSLAGAFNTSGYASNYVKRTTAQGGPVIVEMTLQWTNGVIDGSVFTGNTNWISRLNAEKSGGVPASAEYTVVLGPGTNAAGKIPPGFGYGLITNHNGSVTLSGALADGTTYSQNVHLGVSNDVPVYARLYSNAGLILGWLGLSNGNVQAEKTMVWIKPVARTGIYTAGFTNYLSVTGSGWTNPPAHTPAIVLTNGTLIVTNTGLALDFNVSVTNNTIVKEGSSPAGSLAGSVNPKTGLMTVTFGNGNGNSATTGHAAILQNADTAGGYFTTATNAGTIEMRP